MKANVEREREMYPEKIRKVVFILLCYVVNEKLCNTLREKRY